MESSRAPGAANDAFGWNRGGIAAFKFQISPATSDAVPAVSTTCDAERPLKIPCGWLLDEVPTENTLASFTSRPSAIRRTSSSCKLPQSMPSSQEYGTNAVHLRQRIDGWTSTGEPSTI